MAGHVCGKERELGELQEKVRRHDEHCHESDRAGGFREKFVTLGVNVHAMKKQIAALRVWLILAGFLGGYVGGLTGRLSPSLVDWIRKIAFAQARAEEVQDAVLLPAGETDNASRAGLVPRCAEKGAGA
jgi:hypothetical protein